ncbi:YtxH domain-containing protein [Mesobacillus maritimus]|uniref:YtxH domain-containing protein n=1 Tax=Mesobacillus maritimus TaxID=1643336 RepID=A0ABS7K9M8_9BACI|nr:YtxH domain-containing protein [Mesobacillus maritimus]MBY0098967.1 YtxH domain-containing protein [Mesobacillus maritimus]
MASREMNGKEGSKTRDFLAGAFIGALAGAAAALLFAPKSGKDLRTTINGQTNNILEKTDKVKERALSKSNELATVAKEKATSVVQSVSHQSHELLEKVKDKQIGNESAEGEGADSQDPSSMNSDEIQRKLAETQRAFDETELKLNH